MEAYQQQQPRFIRPPQQPMPPAADPQYQYHHQYQPQQPPRATPMQPPFGYSNQFQFQPHQSHSSPSPPPPWPPRPDPSAYHPPPSLPYQAGPHFPPPPPASHLPPHQIPHSYHQASNQDGGKSNWSHHQVHSNVEDWGAKAREWANSRAAMQQQPQAQYTQSNTSEEHNHRFGQTFEPHYLDTQSLQTSSYQQFPISAAPPQPPTSIYHQETFSTSSVPYYAADGQPLYHVRDSSTSGYLPQGSLTATPPIHSQEVPSSYSPASGKKDSAEPELSSKPFPLPISSGLEVQHHAQYSLPAAGRSASVEESFMYGSQGLDATADLSDRPLDFAPRYNGNHDQMQTNYTARPESMGVARSIEPVAAIPSMNSWASPVAAGVVYTPISSVPVTATQHDPSMAIPSAFGHIAPPFSRFPAPALQPAVPSNGASFGLGTGTPLHPVAAFSGDIYGSFPERPKKAPVPNWLKEELFKSSTLLKPSLDNLKELQSVEDDSADKSFGKGDQADNKSLDSSRSTEDEDDEDYVEAAKAAAINQEIKRVLTEVLLKVTDELFDEIVTMVIDEDDAVAEDQPGPSNRKALQPAPASSNSRALARVVVSMKDLGAETVNGGEKSRSSSPENVLGLSNYASDDDEDSELQSSSMTEPGENAVVQPSSSTKYAVDKRDADNIASSKLKHDRNGGTEKNSGMNPDQLKSSKTIAVESRDDRAGVEYDYQYSSKVVTRDAAHSLKLQDKDGKSSRSDASPVEEDSRVFDNKIGKGSVTHDSHSKDSKMKTDKNDKHENKSFSGRDSVRREAEKSEEDDQKLDEKHLKRETTVVATKEKVREHGARTGEIAKESERGRKPNHLDVMEERKNKDRSHRMSTKEETDTKKESKKAGDRSIHKQGSESSRHKRRRSSSISSRGRVSKDNSGAHADDSNDEVSNDSRSKMNSRKRDLSPSPDRSRRSRMNSRKRDLSPLLDRSRRRQVLRSPCCKHYQRRHSPYSSHETSRRWSRSSSPVQWQR